ncbi:Ankyrin repeat protein 2 [Giardia muris]|uniref:Ankyrin repeat protein 2 n=1 Tax=Giardia muris TaxID=5742 RepID=A0A4Z1TB26_GIAMU|nr:Ankyrin repeat protein 2 [Giardia muris]|eukprot:TNJ30447.1 Ankyrin repeat protein 2 [Giardia muris]
MALLAAAQQGDSLAVKRHLADVGQKDEFGWTALMYAAEQGYLECVQILAEHETHLHNPEGITALMLAAYCGHAACVRVLLVEAGTQTLCDSEWLFGKLSAGGTALMLAAARGHREVVDVLRPHEIGLETADKRTAYSLARELKRTGVLDLLELERQDQDKGQDSTNQTPESPQGLFEKSPILGEEPRGIVTGIVPETPQKVSEIHPTDGLASFDDGFSIYQHNDYKRTKLVERGTSPPIFSAEESSTHDSEVQRLEKLISDFAHDLSQRRREIEANLNAAGSRPEEGTNSFANMHVSLEKVSGTDLSGMVIDDLQRLESSLDQELKRVFGEVEWRRRIACKICGKEPCCTRLLPCLHVCTCMDCIKATQPCPLCGVDVESVEPIRFNWSK